MAGEADCRLRQFYLAHQNGGHGNKRIPPNSMLNTDLQGTHLVPLREKQRLYFLVRVLHNLGRWLHLLFLLLRLRLDRTWRRPLIPMSSCDVLAVREAHPGAVKCGEGV